MLARARAGDGAAKEALLPVVYEELRGLARAVFSRERRDHTLQPTALVHEAWLRIAPGLVEVGDRRHFFVIAGRVMRQLLIEHSRKHKAAKRGGDWRRVAFGPEIEASGEDGIDLSELVDALDRLAGLNERHGQIAELRLFSGLTLDETAAELNLSPRTVDAEWAFVKLWLRTELSGS